MTLMYLVRQRRQLLDRTGRVIANPGDYVPLDDENAKRTPSAVRMVDVAEPDLELESEPVRELAEGAFDDTWFINSEE